MSFLDELPHDHRELIVSLPYRVGAWISHADDVGGDVADEEEKTALANILHGFTQDVFGSEVVQYVMAETISRKQDWEKWATETKNVSEDCQRAIDLLHDVVDEKEVNAFKQRLLEIAEAVALAFREYDKLDFITKLRIYIMYYREKYKAARKNRSFKSMDQYLNISLKERQTLNALASVLEIQYS